MTLMGLALIQRFILLLTAAVCRFGYLGRSGLLGPWLHGRPGDRKSYMMASTNAGLPVGFFLLMAIASF